MILPTLQHMLPRWPVIGNLLRYPLSEVPMSVRLVIQTTKAPWMPITHPVCLVDWGAGTRKGPYRSDAKLAFLDKTSVLPYRHSASPLVKGPRNE
uniref:Uncharacterized protein n=1 Tax=Aegilops tauschii subsp. strangulata TaxID=200361 RepID=A0A453DW39_AEGTS